ncbi:MAG: hypothetical protein FWE01_01770 [Firmicutes bacterium]|nr:hypothetical protein [Bacillota bacterium]
MRKGLFTAIVVLSVGIAMTLVGSILLGFAGSVSVTTFDMQPLSVAFLMLGILATVLAGVAFVAMSVAKAIRENNDDKK